jgi:hypothetical protein
MGASNRKTAERGNMQPGRHCPFLEKPFADCLCLDMDSQKTFGVLDYCQSNFEQCEIFQKNRPALKGLPFSVDGDA